MSLDLVHGSLTQSMKSVLHSFAINLMKNYMTILILQEVIHKMYTFFTRLKTLTKAISLWMHFFF